MGRRKGKISAMASCSLIKDQSKRGNHRKGASDSFLHTTDLQDGTDYNRIDFQSVTEQSNLEEFLNTADMANRDFTAERQNIQVISNPGVGVTLTDEDYEKIFEAQDSNKQLLRIPRRPFWDETTTKEELNLAERESFTNWRRSLKLLEEKDHIQMTPYEKNLDFWRQLWRVIERSDIIVQIVDARNPLLFRCEDLEEYVKEVNPNKKCMLLINKADYLNNRQRQEWVDFFNKEGITVVFFSALIEKEKQDELFDHELDSNKLDTIYDTEDYYDDSSHSESEDDQSDEKDNQSDSEHTHDTQTATQDKTSANSDTVQSADITTQFSQQATITEPDSNTAHNSNTSHNSDTTNVPNSQTDETSSKSSSVQNNPDIITADKLLDFFRTLAAAGSTCGETEAKVIGMVGYPNVGKSSTINVILQEKKLGVSATPGRTKHLQTLNVDSSLTLCDCPGLVFPSFVATKAHLVINGILPIDELRDHVPPTSLVCSYIPRDVLGATYSIMIPKPSKDDINPHRPPTAEEFLIAYGAMRGFMTPRGVPDMPRASRYILKDFVKGKLLYCVPPPGISGPDFQDKERCDRIVDSKIVSKLPPPQIASDIDAQFFAKKQSKAHSRGIMGLSDFVRSETLHQTGRLSEKAGQGQDFGGSVSSINSSVGGTKSWKKHGNRNKKEKLRRVHKTMDADL